MSDGDKWLDEVWQRALAQARADDAARADRNALERGPGGPSALIKALPGVTVRAWEPRSAMWAVRLWACMSVEGWLRQHLDSGTTEHPAGLYRDHKTKRLYCARRLVEFRETIGEVRALLAALGLPDREAILSPDFAVWRSGRDFAFLEVTRGAGEPRSLAELDRQAVIFGARIGEPEP